MSEDFGTVTYNGVTIRLIESAYSSEYIDFPPTCEARGVDDEGNSYKVFWEILDRYYHIDRDGHVIWASLDKDAPQQEEDMCDWTKVHSVIRTGDRA